MDLRGGAEALAQGVELEDQRQRGMQAEALFREAVQFGEEEALDGAGVSQCGMVLQEAQGFMGERAEAQGVELARLVILGAHVQDARQVETKRTFEIDAEIGDGQGGGNGVPRAGGGRDLEHGPGRVGRPGRAQGGAFEEQGDARGQFGLGAGQENARRELGILVGRAAAVEEADAVRRARGQQGAGEIEVAGEGFAVAGESGADAEGVGQEGIAEARFRNDAFAQVGQEDGRGGFPLDFEPAEGFARSGGIGPGKDLFAGQRGLQEIAGLALVQAQAPGAFRGGLDQGGEALGRFGEERVGRGGRRGVAAIVEFSEEIGERGGGGALELFQGAQEERELRGGLEQVVEGGGQVLGLAAIEFGEQVVGVVEAEAEGQPILRIGVAENGRDGGVGRLAEKVQPGGQQAAGRSGGEGNPVGQEEGEPVELQAAGEGAGVVRVGRADREGAVAVFGFQELAREGFGFIRGLVENVDLVFGHGQRFVFPAVGEGEAPGVKAVGLGLRGQDVQVDRTGIREGFQRPGGQGREVGNEQGVDAGIGRACRRAPAGLASGLEGVCQAERGDIL